MSWQRKLLGSITIATATFVASCSLVTDLNGLAGGQAGEADGGGTDGGVDVLAATTHWCDGAGAHHSFCADFDESPFATGWSSSPPGKGGATIGPVATEYRSAPTSLRVSTPVTGTFESSAHLNRTFPDDALTTGIHIELDTKVTHIDAKSLFIAGATISQGTTTYDLLLAIAPAAAHVQAFEASKPLAGAQFPFSRALPLGTWTRVTFDIVLSPAPVLTVTLSSAGQTEVALDHAPFSPVLTRGTATFVLGYDSPSDPGACEIFFDNVTVDVY